MAGEINVVIRKYRVADRQRLRQIFHDTAFMGEPATIFFEGSAIISDALTLYFTDYEPQSCFIAETEGRVIGCLIGTKDKASAEKFMHHKIYPQLLFAALREGVLFKKKNLIFIFNCLLSSMRGEFKMSDFSHEYPATLHINVEQGYRNLKVGSCLIDAYLSYLAAEKVKGVHFATVSEDAGRFFSREGFQLLHQGKRSYFRHILHRDIPVFIYGKKVRIDSLKTPINLLI